MRKMISSAAVAVLVFGGAASAKEYPVGQKQQLGGMEVGAVYLQPIEMDPPGMMRAAKDSDVHLEADIHASKGNPNGFAEGDWIPYLAIGFELTKLDDGQTVKGEFMPMVANDGPHYGENVKMFGPGKYKLTLKISPPNSSMHNHFGRHTDKETGVGEWFKPLTAVYEFTYAGIGKKGGY